MGRSCKKECVECGLMVSFKKLSGGEPVRGVCLKEGGPDPTRLEDLNDSVSNIVSLARRQKPVETAVTPADEVKPRFLSRKWFDTVFND